MQILKYKQVRSKQIITYQQVAMANIIELQQQQILQPFQTIRFFRESLKTTVRRQYNNQCKKIHDTGKQISLFLQPSQHTYRLSTMWCFQLDKPMLLLKVSFYNKQQNDFLRALSDRIKIETYILMRIINATVNGYQFRIDTSSGTVRVEYSLAWANFYRVFSKLQNIINFIKTLFNFFRKYDQLMNFVEFNKTSSSKIKDDCTTRIQKFKYIMKSRKSMRSNLQGSIGDMFRLKQMKQSVPAQTVSKLKDLFMQSLNMFAHADFQQNQQFDKQNLQRQLMTIQKNQSGLSSGASSTKVKIVMGLSKIKQDGSTMDSKISDQGGHSTIFRKKFKYSLIDTINNGTVNYQPEQWKNRMKQTKGDLAYKICHQNKQSSVNSFRNQLHILRQLKEDYSPYIARYYLLVKEAWDEKDTIYMNVYRDNIYSMFTKHKAFPIRTKLVITYGIAKGMCFLWSKGILHRDFKPQNILIDSTLNPKIIDFGSCSPQHNNTTIKVHDERLLYTQGFHNPYETLTQQLKTKLTRDAYQRHPLFDIFGFGRTLCFIFFSSFTPPTPEILKCEPNADILEHILYLVHMCLQMDPDERPTFGEIASYIGVLPQLLISESLIKQQCKIEMAQLQQCTS